MQPEARRHSTKPAFLARHEHGPVQQAMPGPYPRPVGWHGTTRLFRVGPTAPLPHGPRRQPSCSPPPPSYISGAGSLSLPSPNPKSFDHLIPHLGTPCRSALSSRSRSRLAVSGDLDSIRLPPSSRSLLPLPDTLPLFRLPLPLSPRPL